MNNEINNSLNYDNRNRFSNIFSTNEQTLGSQLCEVNTIAELKRLEHRLLSQIPSDRLAFEIEARISADKN